MHSTLFRLEYSLHSSCTLHTYLYALFPPPTLCTTRLRTIHTTAKCTFHTCTSRVTLRTILTTTQCTLHTCTSRVNRQCIVCILPSIYGNIHKFYVNIHKCDAPLHADDVFIHSPIYSSKNIQLNPPKRIP